MTIQTKINTLKSMLPSSPFVAEQVSYALKYAQESASEEALVESLDMAILLADMAGKYSEPNFYKYVPIVCALLLNVSDETSLDMFATETNSVLQALAEFRTYLANFNAPNTRECAVMMAKEILANKFDLPQIIFTWMLQNLKDDKAVNTRIAYLMQDLKINGFEFTGATYELYNKVLVAVNKAEF